MQDYIAHYGIKRRSGRYPWGSGDRPYQSSPKQRKIDKLTKKKEKAETKLAKTEYKIPTGNWLYDKYSDLSIDCLEKGLEYVQKAEQYAASGNYIKYDNYLAKGKEMLAYSNVADGYAKNVGNFINRKYRRAESKVNKYDAKIKKLQGS